MITLTATSDLVDRAAGNNAMWCDAVCRAHGRPGEFQEELWLNRLGTPRFYPDAVTVAGPDAASRQLKAISTLLEAPHTGPWAVKDSFSSLDLGSLGFQSLFEAEWITLNPLTSEIDSLPPGYSWIDIRSAPELAVWEDSWRGEGDGTANKSEERTFQAPLLAQRGIRFVAIRHDGRTVGGGILNQGCGVVGVSNVFVRGVEPLIIWQGLVARAVGAFPGMILVGYEGGRDLDPALRSGFRTLRPLRVWLSGR